MKERQREYRIAAVAWKKAGNGEQAIQLVRISKQFDAVIEALGAGNPIDLSDMPASPSMPETVSTISAPPASSGKEESEAQHDTPPSEPKFLYYRIDTNFSFFLFFL